MNDTITPIRPLARWGTLAALLLASAGAAAHDGARLYQQRCAQCHSAERMGEIVQRLGPDDAVRQRLEALLPRHHASDAADREAIVLHVLTLRPAK